ncbi:MAG: HlyD family secretion protein [Gammaproteobacteria bacterium]|nr:HlyD family secretion protein [Gammaproteobacteria bacterium]
MMRKLLLLLGPVVVLGIVAWYYLTSGRFIATDNAYVKAVKIMVTPEVTGAIREVHVDDNQHVNRGDVLFEVDTSTYQLQVERATAALHLAETRVEELRAEYRQKQADIERAAVEVTFAERDLEREAALKDRNAVSQARVDDAQRRRESALKEVASLQEEQLKILASLAGDVTLSTAAHPSVMAASAELERAQLDLERTTVYAPASGIIGDAPHQGDFARGGVPQTSLVLDADFWIDANFKETELENVKPGMPVAVRVDTYPDIELSGTVESISPATGAEFSVLPAQNATGNWVKVVQRIPVRIALVNPPADVILRSGMSTTVEVDTGSYPHWRGAQAH